jgi:hypothetical protein
MRAPRAPKMRPAIMMNNLFPLKITSFPFSLT